MEIVYVGNRNKNNRALIISNEEWKRLGKILTKKIDDEEAMKDSKHLKKMRRDLSKQMVDGWNNTELNKTKKLLEQKRKALNELETKRQQRDEELKREVLEAKNAIIERSQRLKFEEMDAVKTFNRAIQHCEMFKEREIQLKFNEETRAKKMEKDLLLARYQNKLTEQYKKEQMNEKQKNEALKRAKAETLLKELKYRDDKRRDERIMLYERGKAEMNNISVEIEKLREKNRDERKAAKEKIQKDITENRELITKNDEMRRLEEWEEDMVTAIMAETKKILARTRQLKEIELMRDKQMALEEMRTKMMTIWPTKEIGWADSDVLDAIHAEDQRCIDQRCKKNELIKKRAKYIESGKKFWKEEVARRQEWLAWDHKLEAERLEREKKLLSEYAELCKNKQIENAVEFRKQLDKQCNDKKSVLLMEKQADIDRHIAFEQQWHKEDKQFIAFARNVIEKKKVAGDPILPLLKVVKDYQDKNNLCIDQDNKVSKKTPKGSIYMSRIIH